MRRNRSQADRVVPLGARLCCGVPFVPARALLRCPLVGIKPSEALHHRSFPQAGRCPASVANAGSVARSSRLASAPSQYSDSSRCERRAKDRCGKHLDLKSLRRSAGDGHLYPHVRRNRPELIARALTITPRDRAHATNSRRLPRWCYTGAFGFPLSDQLSPAFGRNPTQRVHQRIAEGLEEFVQSHLPV